MSDLALLLPEPALPALLADDLDAARDFATQEKAAATRAAYASDWRNFCAWETCSAGYAVGGWFNAMLDWLDEHGIDKAIDYLDRVRDPYNDFDAWWLARGEPDPLHPPSSDDQLWTRAPWFHALRRRLIAKGVPETDLRRLPDDFCDWLCECAMSVGYSDDVWEEYLPRPLPLPGPACALLALALPPDPDDSSDDEPDPTPEEVRAYCRENGLPEPADVEAWLHRPNEEELRELRKGMELCKLCHTWHRPDDCLLNPRSSWLRGPAAVPPHKLNGKGNGLDHHQPEPAIGEPRQLRASWEPYVAPPPTDRRQRISDETVARLRQEIFVLPADAPEGYEVPSYDGIPDAFMDDAIRRLRAADLPIQWLKFDRERLSKREQKRWRDGKAGTSEGTLSDIPANEDDRGFELTEDGIALAFAARHRDELRYDHHQRAWFRYDGRAWRKEETQLAFAWARALCRDMKRQALGTATNGELKAMTKAATYAAVETIAKADRAFAVTSEIWDRDPWLLGTPGGTVDLRTGKLRPAKQSNFISMLTAMAPAETADCPVWLKFLDQITQSDKAVQGYLQRRGGYCLTGITTEQDVMFAWGPGGNGKSTLLNTMYFIMGNYAVNAAIDTFVVTHGDKHTTDLAMLHRARLVITTEIDEGRTWDTARLKTMSGQDPITARFMHRNNFTFMPQFKLAISGNHKPNFRSVDDAIKRRISLVEFLRRFPVNKKLADQIKREAPGILRWMIDGCLEWQRSGLNPPQSVNAATEEYLAEQDATSRWIDECCIRSGWGSSASLYGSWRAWAEARGERVGTSMGLSEALKKLGFKKGDFRTERGFSGIHVRPEAPRWVPD